MPRLLPSATALGLILLTASALAQQAADAVAPEIATEAGAMALSEAALAAMAARDAGQPVTAENWMLAAANPLAVEAGADVLRAGGTAADAMVAVQAVLGLVEPQSSGLGGGAFLVWYDAATGEITTLDGRETAPLAVTPTLFQDENGEPLGFFDAVVGGLSVGTPGTPALMEEAHRRWGRANWGGLFDAAIGHAEDGFAVSPRLAGAIANDAERLSTFPATAAYFLPDGAPLAEGALLRNPAYATTLRAMAAGGADVIYSGPIAEGIVDTVRSAEGNPGLLSLRDLEIYEVVERAPVCVTYRAHEVCGMGPPSSGALTVGQILGMASAFDLAALGPDSVEAWRIIGDASRLAFADRGRYMADSDFVPMPTQGLVDPDYLAERATLLEGDDALPEVAPGEPAWDHAFLWADDQSLELPSTSHISIVDDDDHRKRLRRAPDGAGRVSPEQRADRFLVPDPCRWPPHRQPDRAGQAPPLLDGADDRAARRRTGSGRGLPRGQPHHRLCGADHHRPSGLGHGCAAGRRDAPSGQPVRHL